jgi:WD40-like Beta Propeller Repeat
VKRSHYNVSKRVGIFSLFILLTTISYAQTAPAPQPGSWHCSILGIGGETVLTPTYDGENTGTIYDRYSVPVYYDSDLGDLILDEFGGYTLTGVAKSGGYQYNAATGVISFTGFLGTLKTEYGYEDKENTSLVVGITADGTFHTCRLGEANGGQGNTTNPLSANTPLNGGIQGVLLGGADTIQERPHGGTIYEVNLASATGQPKFQGGEPYRAFNGEVAYVNSNDVVVIAGLDGLTASTFQTRHEFTYHFSLYPALSADGQMIAYMDANTDAYARPDLPGYGVMVKARDGRTITFFPGMTQPAWAPNNDLVMVGSQVLGDKLGSNGLFMVSASTGQVTQIGQGLDLPQMPTVSPDGSTILFIHGRALWAIGTDSSNQRVINNSAALVWPAFSPDGVYVSALFNDFPYCLVGIGKLDASIPPFTVTDDKGNAVRIPCNRVVWR